jgi:hypothetical protein
VVSIRTANRRLSGMDDETRRLSNSVLAMPQHNFTVSSEQLTKWATRSTSWSQAS